MNLRSRSETQRVAIPRKDVSKKTILTGNSAALTLPLLQTLVGSSALVLLLGVVINCSFDRRLFEGIPLAQPLSPVD